MNTDSLIREEIDMQSSKKTLDESDFMELARIAEMGIAEEQANSAEFQAKRDSLLQDAGIEDPTKKNKDNHMEMESAETIITNSTEEMSDSVDNSELDCVMQHSISNKCGELMANQDSRNHLEIPEIDEMTTAEVANEVEAITSAVNVSQDTNDRQGCEESTETLQNNAGLVPIPDNVLMDAVEEITHSTVEKTLEENVSDEAIAKDNPVDKKIIDQVGHLTRNLHNSLRELGYDKRLQSFASEVPEAQDKLSYVASKTEQAADRTLNATEIAMPIQEKLSIEATQLSEKWVKAFEEQKEQPDTEKFKLLLIETLSYIDKIPEQADATNAQLMEIMMAQDFQDLTGQVIKKITYMVQRLEHDLVQLLLANVPISNKPVSSEEGLMNGPVVNPEKSPDTLNSQDQVDDLLASLGF